MSSNKEDTWQVIKAALGKKVERIYLIAYVFNDKTNWDNTLLQISFTDSSVILLTGASDGESLKAKPSAWIDPFVGQLNRENKEFIHTYGKWSLFDVSDKRPFSLLVGRPIKRARPIFDQFGVMNGVELLIDDNYLNFLVEWDECHILWGKNNSTLLARGNKRGYSCPCCGYLTLGEMPPGTFEICPVCFWEDDYAQYHNPDMTGGANRDSLNQARKNFLEFGANSTEDLKFVRDPLKEEIPPNL